MRRRDRAQWRTLSRLEMSRSFEIDREDKNRCAATLLSTAGRMEISHPDFAATRIGREMAANRLLNRVSELRQILGLRRNSPTVGIIP